MLDENREVRWVPFKYLFEKVEAVLNKNYRYNKGLPDSTPTSERWCWSSNSRCKYIGFRIDMRDGKAVLYDRDGKCISIAELEFQLGARPNEAYPSQVVIPLEEWAERDLGIKLVSDISCHIMEFVESHSDKEDLLRCILGSLRQHLREGRE